MLKKTITYEDYFGTVRTEDFYFHLSKQELSAMQMSVEGGFNAYLEKMRNAVNNKEIYHTFVEVVLAAYGEISEDGRYHLKEDKDGCKLYKKFMQSPAYDVLMDEICQNESTITEFVKGIMPKEIGEKAAAQAKIEAMPKIKPNGEYHPNK